MEQQQPNNEYIKQSFLNQLADLHLQIANRDATITEQFLKIEELQKELEEYREKEIEEMDEPIENTTTKTMENKTKQNAKK